MNIENTLKKLALSYLSKYDSTRKNLEMILKKKIFRMKETSKKEKFLFYDSIKKILDEFESKKIINDENFAEIKIKNAIIIPVKNSIIGEALTNIICIFLEFSFKVLMYEFALFFS